MFLYSINNKYLKNNNLKTYCIVKNLNCNFSTNTKDLRCLATTSLKYFFKNFTGKAKYMKTESYLKTTREALIPITTFLHLHSYSKFSTLIDIAVVDTPGKLYRFSVNYYLLSVFSNMRLRLTLYTNEVIWVPTLTKIFDNANWLEREAWDTYGVFFLEHPDLRRILMDYGFSGFPFRKDFPLSGFKDLRYQETIKRFKYVSVKNVKFRKFKFNNPWWTA